MQYLLLQQRDICWSELSLGVVIAIVLCGSIVVFTVVGLFMSWRMKVRQKRAPARMYTTTDKIFPTRLTKRPFLESEFAMGALSSRFHSCSSLETPLISPLPPLPSYDSVDRYHDGSKRRARGRSWVAGDDFRGQSVINRFTRESRFGTESGIQQAPTIPSLPNVDVNEDTEGKRWQNSRYAQPCEYCTKQQHPEEYAGKPYESKFQQPHYRRQDKPKMRHLNQEERDIQHHTPSGRTAEGEALPWGRGWRVPDPYRAMPRSGSFKPLPISATGLGLQ